MATHNKTLNIIASKLGLGDEEKVINKAAEFERLLQTKTVGGSNMSDTSKLVICLDLAAGIFGADIDMKTAIKYSGLKAAMYTNNRKVVQNLLELNDNKVTTLVLCNALECTSVQKLADNIIEEYQKQAKVEVDPNLPQYVCMAVYQACRVSKVKLAKSKIIEKSRLKPAQWTKLEADWTKLVDEKFPAVKRKRERQDKDKMKTETLEGQKEDKMEIEVPKIEEQPEPQTEPYKEWKKRIVEAAYRELKKMTEEKRMTEEKKMKEENIKFSLTPRRSPRKTPQKVSPVKSPVKKGVRLLFPLNLK